MQQRRIILKKYFVFLLGIFIFIQYAFSQEVSFDKTYIRTLPDSTEGEFKVFYTCVYDENNNLIKKTQSVSLYENGKETSKEDITTYEYNSRNLLIYSDGFSGRINYEYDENDKLIHEYNDNKSKDIVYEYDIEGNLVYKKEYDRFFDRCYETLYLYDDNNRLIYEKHFQNDELISEEYTFYLQNSKFTRTIYSNNTINWGAILTGGSSNKFIEYDDNNNEIHIIGENWEQKNTYDENGNKTSFCDKRWFGTHYTYYSYDLDKNKNVIVCYSYIPESGK